MSTLNFSEDRRLFKWSGMYKSRLIIFSETVVHINFQLTLETFTSQKAYDSKRNDPLLVKVGETIHTVPTTKLLF